MIDSHTPVVRQLEAIQAKLRADNVQILRADAIASAHSMALRGQRYDLVFLDPPYHQDLLMKSLPLCQQLLTEDGLVYAEAGAPLPFAPEDGSAPPDWLAPWELVRSDKAGMVFYHLLRLRKPAP
jgi:16S rRNA (guanine966-N2)-methyltransferase